MSEENKRAKNRCAFMGRVVKDCVITEYAAGKHLVDFSLAVQNDYKQNNEWVKDTLFIDCQAFGDVAKNLTQYIKKGRMIAVYGKLKMQRYESKKYKCPVTKMFLLVGAIDCMLNDSSNAISPIEKPDFLANVPASGENEIPNFAEIDRLFC